MYYFPIVKFMKYLMPCKYRCTPLFDAVNNWRFPLLTIQKRGKFSLTEGSASLYQILKWASVVFLVLPIYLKQHIYQRPSYYIKNPLAHGGPIFCASTCLLVVWLLSILPIHLFFYLINELIYWVFSPYWFSMCIGFGLCSRLREFSSFKHYSL